MSDFELFSTDELSQIRTYLKINKDTAEIVHQQNVTPILEYAKEKKKQSYHGQMIGNTQNHWDHVAEIPNDAYLQGLKKFGPMAQNQKAWKKWLNENNHFKTSVRDL